MAEAAAKMTAATKNSAAVAVAAKGETRVTRWKFSKKYQIFQKTPNSKRFVDLDYHEIHSFYAKT